MAVEQKRGCGYRKVGGLYLVGDGIGVPCDRLPFLLDICPTCGNGIKQSRGWTWVDINGLFQGPHVGCGESVYKSCVLCDAPETMGKAGLLWIGAQFYKTPDEFVAEGVAQGFSRRIHTLPRGFGGKTWVLLAHAKTIPTMVPKANAAPLLSGEVEMELKHKPGIFYVWQPQRIEKICKESTRGSEGVAELEKRGITPVFVPDNDPNHQGSVFDDEPETEAQPLL